MTPMLLLAAIALPGMGGDDAATNATPASAAGLAALEARVVDVARKVSPSVVYLPDGRGSGVIISADGLVLSQRHVSHAFGEAPLKPGDAARAVLADGRRVDATLLGADEIHDVSLLRLAGPGPYPFAELGPPGGAGSATGCSSSATRRATARAAPRSSAGAAWWRGPTPCSSRTPSSMEGTPADRSSTSTAGSRASSSISGTSTSRPAQRAWGRNVSGGTSPRGVSGTSWSLLDHAAPGRLRAPGAAARGRDDPDAQRE